MSPFRVRDRRARLKALYAREPGIPLWRASIDLGVTPQTIRSDLTWLGLRTVAPSGARGKATGPGRAATRLLAAAGEHDGDWTRRDLLDHLPPKTKPPTVSALLRRLVDAGYVRVVGTEIIPDQRSGRRRRYALTAAGWRLANDAE